MRKRNINISFRVDENEKKQIEERLREQGVTSVGNYLRTMALMGEVVKVDTSALRECNNHLSAIGNNINQIAKKINIVGRLEQGELTEIQNAIWNVRLMVVARLEELTNNEPRC